MTTPPPIPRPIPPETLRTSRLVLRPHGMADMVELAQRLNEPGISEYTRTIPFPYTLDDAREFLHKHERELGAGDAVVFAIRTADDGPLMGGVGLHLVRADRRAELGYWMNSAYRGKGYTSEAAAAALAFGFNTLHLDRIHACWYHDNPASGRILEKIGMKPEGIMRAHSLRGGRRRDIVNTGMLREEFEEIAAS